MREIKVRVWHRNIAKFVQPSRFLILDSDGVLYNSDCDIEQYTGLLDRNGVEIYEGDIVKSSAHHPDTYKVAFGDCQYYAMTMSGPFITIELDHFEDSTGCCLEVIGNIHQNPELL